MFATPSLEAWKAEAARALKGAPLEGLERIDADGLTIRPLYTAETAGQPLFAPRAADADGRPWDLRTRVEADDPGQMNQAVLTDLEGGAASVLLAGEALLDPAPLSAALDGVALELAGAALDAGFDGPQAASALAVVAKGSPRAKLSFHLDPIGAFAEAGGAPREVEALIAGAAAVAARHVDPYPEARLFLASGRVVHEAGGSAAEALGFAAACAAAYVRAAEAAGVPVPAVLARTTLGVAVDAEHFDALCQVRALRLIWRSLSRGFGAERPAHIEARSSRRMLSARDPWPNLLRLTAAGFAAAVGGAEAVVLDGFTAALGRPDAFARRQARNAQLVLMEEAGLGRVLDPAAGAWFLDARTRDLAEAGWAAFQRIEAEGGVVAALRAGTVQARVADARRQRQAALADGRAALVGVTRFVDPEPRTAAAGTVRPVSRVLDGDACQPLGPIRWAAAAEAAA